MKAAEGGMHQNVSINTRQQLILTPKLVQSLKILSMNAIELKEYVNECLDSNPMLENDAPSSDQVDAPPPLKEDKPLETDWREQGDDRWESMYPSGFRSTANPVENMLRAEESVGQNLHDQVDCQPMSKNERFVAHAIIDSLNDDGYFCEDETDLTARLKVDSREITEVLETIVQQLLPKGIGARNLRECLLMQLDGETDTDRLASNILLNHSEHLFDSDHELAAISACSIEEIKAARARMRRLDPFPGHYIRNDYNIYIHPEIIFHRQPDHSLRIEIPDSSWRGIRLNTMWQGHAWQGADQDFMNNATREATWLLQALEQRRQTLDKVARCLAKRQRRFLDFGPIGLKPLTLQEVAAEVGLHESTISRVTNGKYAQTPLGLIEMKKFFSAGLPVRGGGSIAVYKVQQRIRALIESEPCSRPIADMTISEILQEEGIRIARRTVAKYREQLGFGPAHQRRRIAGMQACLSAAA